MHVSEPINVCDVDFSNKTQKSSDVIITKMIFPEYCKNLIPMIIAAHVEFRMSLFPDKRPGSQKAQICGFLRVRYAKKGRIPGAESGFQVLGLLESQGSRDREYHHLLSRLQLDHPSGK